MKKILNNIWNYIVNKMPGELMVSLLIMFLIAIFAIVLGHAIKKADPKKPPKGLAFIADFAVDKVISLIESILGDAYDVFAPYVLFLVSYIPLAFMAGLFGLASPMTYFTIPLCLALVSWLGINLSAIRYQKLDYLKGFTSPLPAYIPLFIPINMLSKLAPLMSLSIRMFGNALAGYILMYLVYWGCGKLSALIFQSAQYNFVSWLVAPILHAYFDIFGAFIQTLIFVLLSMLLISSEIPAPVHKKIKKANAK